MSALYVRDTDGKFIPVKTIKGDKGDTGANGHTPEKGLHHCKKPGDELNRDFAVQQQ